MPLRASLASSSIGDRGQPEVHDADLTVGVDHDVRGLEVAVQNAFRMGSRKARAELPRDLDPFVDRQPADALQQRRQILAVDVLHRQIKISVRLADVVDAADVGVCELTREAHLVAQPRTRALIESHRLRVVSGFGWTREKLQRDWLPQLEIVGAVHFAHPAATESRDDAEATGKERAGSEPAFIALECTRGRPTCPAETVRGAEQRITRRALRREPLVQSRRPGQSGTIEQAVMVRVGREHALDFLENQRVVATRSSHICAPFGLGSAQRRLEYFPDSTEIVRADRFERRKLRHIEVVATAFYSL